MLDKAVSDTVHLHVVMLSDRPGRSRSTPCAWADSSLLLCVSFASARLHQSVLLTTALHSMQQ